ncbi:hypothetical protein pb186bvf_013093 [Paramecium bursaria]
MNSYSMEVEVLELHNKDLQKLNDDKSKEIIRLTLMNTQLRKMIQEAAQQKLNQDQLQQQDIIIQNLQEIVQEQSDDIVRLNIKLNELGQKLIEKDLEIENFQKLLKEKPENNFLLKQRIIELEKQIENQLNKQHFNEDSLSRFLSEGDPKELDAIAQLPQAQPRDPSNVIYQKDLINLKFVFVIDTTESMSQQQRLNSQSAVKQLDENLKQQDKDIKYAVVTYKDYEEYNQQNLYEQKDFDAEINEDLKIYRKIRDLQNGLNQALKLKWQSMKKIIIIFTDAPCHGQKYNQGVSDKFPQEDMVDQLDKIIAQKINLICVGFKREHNLTKQMFKEFRKYLYSKDYKKIQRYAVDVNCQNKTQDFIQFALKALKDILQSKDQPQQSTIYQQIHDNLVLKFEFLIFTCDLDTQKLSQYLDNDNKSQLVIHQNFFQFKQQGEFVLCEREGLPFYQDSTKKIFKMMQQRYNGQVDFYAITTSIDGPFKSKLEAAQFIKSHLITKVLFKQFKDQLADFQKINFYFSNYIILKEKNKNLSDQQEKYWIAQKIYEKEQLYQFNDSEGNLTSHEDSDYNEIIQSFSFFTYYQSNCKLLVCDLQIYKDILLHPKINTHSGQN